MNYKLRDYQQEASDAAYKFFTDEQKYNGLIVAPTGCGKSLIIADIANRLGGNVLVFQPSKEILEQNYKKYCSYGMTDCSIYSASFNKKEISRVTFAMIGSVKSHPELFKRFKYVIVDECHRVNPKEGMYKDFFHALGETKILGLTATPYRLVSYQDYGSMLKFITRSNPRVFDRVIYYVQIQDLLRKGFLAQLDYFDCPPKGWDSNKLVVNSTGADYTDKSVQAEYERVDIKEWLFQIAHRLVYNSKVPRKGILVFTRFIYEADYLVNRLIAEGVNAALVTGDTKPKERNRILEEFKAGEIKVVANAAVLTTGFDYPELDTIVMARPTRSLAMWYQIVGRAIRPSEGKKGWIVDLCKTYPMFGKVEDLWLRDTGRGKWIVESKGRQLTNKFY